MFKTVSIPLAHLIFFSGVNCYDIGSNELPQNGHPREATREKIRLDALNDLTLYKHVLDILQSY
jgi:hypothetical protein